jgi:hypothetical protein
MEVDKAPRLVALKMLINEARNYQQSKPEKTTTTCTNATTNDKANLNAIKSRSTTRTNDYYRMLHDDVTLLFSVKADHRSHVQSEVSAQRLFR